MLTGEIRLKQNIENFKVYVVGDEIYDFGKVKNIRKSQYMGVTWQILTLMAAMAIGLIGVAYFAAGGLAGSELVFVVMAKSLFPPIIAGFVLCAILAAAITTMDSQILVSEYFLLSLVS